MKKILVLGCSSFGGSAFVNFMLDKNFFVIGTYRRKKNILYQPHLKNKNKVNFIDYKIDFDKDLFAIIEIVKKYKPEYIIDFASICMVNESWNNPDVYIKSNLEFKSLFLRHIHKYSFIKKYVYISTPEIFGSNEQPIKEIEKVFNPSTPYAISKLSFEMMLKSYGQSYNFPYTICRFSNFYGAGQPNYRLIPKVILSIITSKKFPLQGNGKSKRDFINSYDFSNGIYLAIIKGKNKSTYHFSTGKYYTIKDVINKICKIKKYDFSKLIKIEKDRKGKDKTYKLNCTFTKKELTWKPKINLDSALKEIIEFYENNLKEIRKLEIKYIDSNLTKN
jgi:dTDP-glucose 4,6-dehydratase